MRLPPVLNLMILPVLNVLGLVIMGFSVAMLIPTLLAVWRQDGAGPGFIVGFLTTLLSGLVIWFCTKSFKRELIPRDGFLLVTLAWVSLAFFSTIPLYMTIPNIAFSHAFFEAVSGITTSCATVLSGLDSLPYSVNFWRCFLSWLGGVGILVMAVAVLPLLGIGGAQIFRAESTGPLKEGRLTPRIADTAKAIFNIYFALSEACAVGSHFAGMDWHDAIRHTFTTVSLGGFSSHDAGFAYWDTRAVDYVCITFLIIGGINFSIHFAAWKSLNLRTYFKDTEGVAWMLTALCASLVAIVFLLVWNSYDNVEDTIYYALTNTIFVISTSGFSNTNYGEWPLIVQILILLISCFATCAGSTGGGIKMIRMIAMVKQGVLEFRRLVHPQLVIPLKIGNKVISSQVVFAVIGFFMLYILLAGFGTMMFLFTGLDGLTAFSTSLAMLNNLGPALGSLGPANTFGALSDFQLYFCTFLMIVGRLEMFTVLVLFTVGFWKS
ncbi:MAG: TrkH family potassium uptake protein [Burkholderiales bacterium]|nr:TrkH family potassium uptake protein [Burkholderiales bacterium]